MSTQVINTSAKHSTSLRSAINTTVSKSTKYKKLPRILATTTSPLTSSPSSPLTINVKSKCTEVKQILTPIRVRNLRLDLQSNMASLTLNKQQPNTHKKLERKVIQSVGKKQRQWNRKEKKAKDSVKIEQRICLEIGIQTHEQEILNHDLLIGDIKFMLPTKSLAFEIDRDRQETKKKALLRTQRKFEEYAEREEEHLTDLKEFLENAVVTKRARKPKDASEIDKKYRLISSMDEILNREVPRTESITDIKGRIKKKEKELIRLFETVENVPIPGNKN